MEELSFCPGLGEKKIKRLQDTFHQPLDPNKKRSVQISSPNKRRKIEPNSSLLFWAGIEFTPKG